MGAGFAGLQAVKGLTTSTLEVTIIDKHNYHLFQPLLYQVATAGLSPADIALPIRNIFRFQKNIKVILDELIKINPQMNQITTRNNTYNTRAGNNLQCGASTNLNSVFKRYGVYGYPS